MRGSPEVCGRVGIGAKARADTHTCTHAHPHTVQTQLVFTDTTALFNVLAKFVNIS